MHDLNSEVTVVIPTIGNRPEFLQQAVSSALNQSIKPKKIIIVNNGKDSLSFSPFYQMEIKIVNTVFKAGVAQARNLGATLAETKYIAFLDDDDLWESEFLENALMSIISKDLDCVLGRIDMLKNGNILKFLNATNYLNKESFLVMNPGATGSNILIKKETFLAIGGYDVALPPAEDGALLYELILKGYKITVNEKAVCIMRMHDGVRLTNPSTAANGYRQFYLKYKKDAKIRDRKYLKWKYLKEEYKNQKTLKSLLRYGVFSLIILVLNRRPSFYWNWPNNI